LAGYIDLRPAYAACPYPNWIMLLTRYIDRRDGFTNRIAENVETPTR
jgi:hypothetical protein